MIGTTPFATDVDIKGENEYVNVFATDTFSVFPWVYVNAAAGWNQANVKLHDRIGTALNGDHSFGRLNPSAGLTFNPLDAFGWKTSLQELTVYGNYNEGFRAPTPIELTDLRLGWRPRKI